MFNVGAIPVGLRAGLVSIVLAALPSTGVPAQIKAQPPSGPLTPAWDKGIQPINRDSYWNAMACGKQGGERPPCVFYDAGLCKNDDFTLALFTPYKLVAYEVWGAVSRQRPAPTPNYAAAQQTRVVIGITPVRGAKNQITNVVVQRGGKTIEPDTRTIDGATGNFIFNFPPFAPTATITLDMVGKIRTQSCVFDRAALSRLR